MTNQQDLTLPLLSITRARHVLTHKRARADASRREAFGRETVIGECDRHSGHTQRPRKLTAGRQWIARSKQAIQNRVTRLPINFGAEIFTADEADVEAHGAFTLIDHRKVV